MQFQHIEKEEEKKFLEEVKRLEYKAEKQYTCIGTSFYNKEWMQTVIKRYIGEPYLHSLFFYGGYEEAERQMIVFGYEDYYQDVLPLTALEIRVKTGIGKPLSHRDFLGALLGLGIGREKIGDIIIKPFGAYVILTKELGDYVQLHLSEVSRYSKISISTISFQEMEVDTQEYKLITGTVSSLRADTVLALGFKISRSLAVKLIEQEKAKCNGMVVKSSESVGVGDVLTLRGYGKIRFLEQGGLTKKDRLHITIQKYM